MSVTVQRTTSVSGRIKSTFQKLVGFGTDKYDERTARRLRLVNMIAIFLIFYLGFATLNAVVILMSSGLSPLSFTNKLSVALMTSLALTGFMHRFSDYAGPMWILLLAAVVVSGNVMVMGRDHGIIFCYIGLIAMAPCLLGNRHLVMAIAYSILVMILFQITDSSAPSIGAAMSDRPPQTMALIRAQTVALVMIIVFLIVWYAFRVADRAEIALEAEYDRSEMLLRNILPDPIALRLKAEPDELIADRHEGVTVLFADIVGFTPRATQNPPEEVVQLLNRVFSEFDGLVEKYGLEKIKTVGDAYMVVAGIPEPHSDGPAAMANFALELMKKTEEVSEELGDEIEVRVGIHTGDAVAGVIGTRKFAYDIWGDTVNTAARMEAFGVPNRIQVTEAVKKALEGRYSFEERGTVDIKGKGEMELYFLLGHQS